MSAVKWLLVEIGQKIDTYEIPDIVIEEALEIEEVRLNQAYQDGKDFAIINHLAKESTSAAHNKEVHRQQIIAAYKAAMHTQYLESHTVTRYGTIHKADDYYNKTYGDGIQ